MKRNEYFLAAAMLAMTFAGATGAQATPAKHQEKAHAEQKVQLKDLPPAVRATVEAESKGGTLKGVSKETEKGKTLYEAETVVNGHSRDVMIDANGKVQAVEEQIDVAKAPAPVKAAMEKHGKIEKLESISENGKTYYEGHVHTKAGKTVKVEVDANGNPVKK